MLKSPRQNAPGVPLDSIPSGRREKHSLPLVKLSHSSLSDQDSGRFSPCAPARVSFQRQPSLGRITQLAGTGLWVSLLNSKLVEVRGANCWPTLELLQAAMKQADIPQSDLILLTRMADTETEKPSARR